MKVILSTACVLLSVVVLADVSEVHPSADQLLHDVVARLPIDPIHVSGKLLVRRRRGVPVASLDFELDAHWGDTPARATYHIRDAFGRSLEELSVTHGESTSYQYATGDPLQKTDLPDLSGAIQETDLSWIDLTFAYLWWPGGKIVGEESIRSFDCYILDIPAPQSQKVADGGPKAESEGASPYASVRLWISKKAHMMLQAEGYDANGKILRRLWVRNFKKIADQWMIKEMEVQRYPEVHRTKLRVTEVETAKP